ncbi:AI-2E family transporter [candidate division WOR-3 bacterium]|nr:AI-2E family transporter [candidate division WOR-3 bacterium]
MWTVRDVLSPPIVALLTIVLLLPQRKSQWIKPFLFLSFAVIILWIFLKIKIVILPFIFAFILAYVIYPLVKKLESLKVPKILAIAAAEFLVIALFAVFLVILVPVLINQMTSFITYLPVIIEWINDRIDVVQSWIDKNDMLMNFGIDMTKIISIGQQDIQGSLLKIKDILLIIINTIWYIIIIPVISFLYLKEAGRLKDFFSKLLSKEALEKSKSFLREADAVIGLYVRSQIIVSILDGIIVGVGMAVMGVRYSVLLGVLAAIFSVIPNFGFLFTVLVTLLITLTGPNPVVMSIKAGVVFVIEEILLAFVITPNIMGSSMGLNPVVVMFSLMVGASMFGVPGLILASPVIALIMRLLSRISEKNISHESLDILSDDEVEKDE